MYHVDASYSIHILDTPTASPMIYVPSQVLILLCYSISVTIFTGVCIV